MQLACLSYSTRMAYAQQELAIDMNPSHILLRKVSQSRLEACRPRTRVRTFNYWAIEFSLTKKGRLDTYNIRTIVMIRICNA